jgi:hypothetical protein
MHKPRYDPPSEKELERQALRDAAWKQIQQRELEKKERMIDEELRRQATASIPMKSPLSRNAAKSARKARRKNRYA